MDRTSWVSVLEGEGRTRLVFPLSRRATALV